MTREEAKKNLVAYMYYAFDDLPENVGRAIDMAIKALEQEPCEDAISREAALEAILIMMPNFCGGEGGNLVDRNQAASAIRSLPSVTPKQKQEPILDKIRAEIEEYNNNTWRPNENSLGNAGWWACNKCIKIIDKYKAESEGK